MVGPLRIRSSIACARCRRSKIKCDNTGRLDAPCENCLRSGNNCVWPLPTALPSKRRDPSSTAGQDSQTRLDAPNTPRKRPRRRTKNTQAADILHDYDVLVVRRIDRGLWDKVLVTYQRHFATELPFLHVPTLKNKIYDLTTGQKCVAFDIHLVLLGLLALTGRYHPELANYLDHQPGEASETQDVPEMFARTMDNAMGSFLEATSFGSVERVQALLMLGLYEWISPNHEGLRAWMLIGAAGRMAQALRLGYEGRSVSASHPLSAASEEVAVDREVRRRTMFSCFIFDRLICCGKERPSFIQSEDLHIKLPCAKEDFDLSREVNSTLFSGGLLGSRENPGISMLGRFIQLVDIWGRISHYTNAGGRFLEKRVPPWDRRSIFFRLRRDLDTFCEILEMPGTFLSLSPFNYFRHENTSSTFVLLHLLVCLCKIMLHRQYLPFIPVKCKKPSGPLDEPTFAPDTVPAGFWEDSSREVFKSSKTVVELIELCGDRLPQSPLVAFVVYTSSFTSIYARYFPHMDPDRLSNSQEDTHSPELSEHRPISGLTGTTKVLFDALTYLAKYSGVASAFVARFNEVDQYFFYLLQDYHRNLRYRATSRQSGERLSVRMGGDTGGLEEWVVKSDRMISNSSIMKETDQPVHDTEAIARGTESYAPVSDVDSDSSATHARIQTLPRESSLAAAESNHSSGFANVEASANSMDERSADDGEPLQSRPQFTVPSQVTGTGSVLLENGADDWSWAFLQDMYLGSVSLDSGDGGPGFSF